MDAYRPNVAALIENAQGMLFVAERMDIPESWQFPQGGVDPGEDLQEALFREVEEEISVPRRFLKVVESKGGYRYDFPQGKRKFGVYVGQEQTYFRCVLMGDDALINLKTSHREFRSWKWIRPMEFNFHALPSFKREVHRKVLWDFYQVSDKEMSA